MTWRQLQMHTESNTHTHTHTHMLILVQVCLNTHHVTDFVNRHLFTQLTSFLIDTHLKNTSRVSLHRELVVSDNKQLCCQSLHHIWVANVVHSYVSINDETPRPAKCGRKTVYSNQSGSCILVPTLIQTFGVGGWWGGRGRD